jgi:CYTH domain-containing protein
MGNEEIQMGEQSKPRFEFRSFEQNFDAAATRRTEVTGEAKYYNAMLMKNPYTKW